MRLLTAIVFGCALMLGVNHAVIAGGAPTTAAPAQIEAPPVQPDSGEIDDNEELGEDNGYECRYSPYCRVASQCAAYCAGGIPVCSRGCCACAS